MATVLVCSSPIQAQDTIQRIQLPCSSSTPGSSFCFGSLANKAALTDSGKSLCPFLGSVISPIPLFSSPIGCMAANDCEILLIGRHSNGADLIQWQMMTSLTPYPHERLSASLAITSIQIPDLVPSPGKLPLMSNYHLLLMMVNLFFLAPPELQNVTIAVETCVLGETTCKFCALYQNGPYNPCVTTGNGYFGKSEGDVVQVDGWKSNPFYRVSFESMTIIEHQPYRVDFLNDKLWPYLETFTPKGLASMAGLSQPALFFCHGGHCRPSSTSTTEPETDTMLSTDAETTIIISTDDETNTDQEPDGETFTMPSNEPETDTMPSTDYEPSSVPTTEPNIIVATTKTTTMRPRTRSSPKPRPSETRPTVPEKDIETITREPSSSSNTKKTGIIIASVIGGILVIAAIGALIWYFVVKKKRPSSKSRKKTEYLSRDTTVQTIDSVSPQ